MVTLELGACERFVYELRRSNLIERGQLDQIVSDCLRENPRSTPNDLAQFLISQGVLSKFQAERVLANKAQGLVVGPYSLVDVLGSGSMGTVYKANSKTDQQVCAVKVLPRRSMWNVRLARRQVRQFSQFNHPAVAPFIDVGTSGGMHYLVWPFIDGEALDAKVQRLGKLSPGQTALIGLQLAQGLNACHQQQISHGLLKPSNVMVSAGNQATILDFGIGSLLAENEGESLVDTMSTANTLTSGLDCASPESILEPTSRTPCGDQYSLGCTLYFCLTGRYPFSEGSAVEKMMAHQFKEPQPIREVVPDAPEQLVAVIDRLMKKKPEDRFGDMSEVVDDLQPLAGDAAAAVTASAAPKAAPRQSLSALRDRTVRKATAIAAGAVTPPASPYPQPSPYPSPTSPMPVRGLARQAAAQQQQEALRQVPTRQALQNPAPESQPDPTYAPPPGYVEPAQPQTQFSPIFYTVLGMGVMAITYFALVIFKPF